MRRIWYEFRLLSFIALVAGTAAIWEISQLDPHEENDAAVWITTLGEVYPDTPRIQHEAGLASLIAGDAVTALPLLRAAYDAGYREKEVSYSTYIHALVLTGADRAKIAEVLTRWQRDHPYSETLAAARQKLHEARVLEAPHR